jgi:nucleotide-binding universal stress UspA family protein
MKEAAMRDLDNRKPPVVVGIDGSQAAIQAAEWAVAEAVGRQVPLLLTYVISEHAEPAPFASVGNERMEHEYGETALRIAAAAVEAVGEPVKVETVILRGEPTNQLVAKSRNAAMICIGSTGIGRVAKLFLGSTATDLAEAAHCSVAIIRSQRGQHVLGRSLIAVAVEDRPGDEIVVKQAIEEAGRRHIPLLALGTWRREVEEMAADELGRRMQLWRSRYPGVEVHTASTGTDVADFLAVIDRRIELTVLGSNDTNQIARLIGPHRHPVLGNAECSVLIARPSGADIGDAPCG